MSEPFPSDIPSDNSSPPDLTPRIKTYPDGHPFAHGHFMDIWPAELHHSDSPQKVNPVFLKSLDLKFFTGRRTSFTNSCR